MHYIMEIVSKEGSGDQDEPISRRIIGDAHSVADACDVIAKSQVTDHAAILLRRHDVLIDDASVSSMMESFSAIDRNVIAVPRILNGAGKRKDAAIPYDVCTPVPSGECALIRMDIYERFGPFDAVHGEDIKEAIVEYALKINDSGYSIVVPGGAIVTLQEGARVAETPLDEEVATLDKQGYLNDLLSFVATASSRKPRILFDFHDMPPFYCGTSEYQVSLLRYFERSFKEKYDVVVRCNAEAVKFHCIESFGFQVMLPDQDGGLFDIGLVANQPVDLEKQMYLNKHCLRIVYTMLDCILLRSNYLASENADVIDVARCGLRNCDGIIAISQFSRSDYMDLFSSDPVIHEKDSAVVYISTDFGGSGTIDVSDKIPFGEYCLVIGNAFKHKALSPVLDAVANTEENYVFVGLPDSVSLPDNVISFPNSTLEESFLDSLYEQCSCVVFPSQYEGFGLPITIAFKHEKKVIACDNDLNRELRAHFSDLSNDLLLFRSFDEIPGLVRRINADTNFHGSLSGTWEGAIIEVEGFLSRLIKKPIDWFFIDARQWEYRLLEEQMERAARRAEDAVGFKRLLWKRFIKGRPVLEKVYRKLILSSEGA